jgi:hypothetical protein
MNSYLAQQIPGILAIGTAIIAIISIIIPPKLLGEKVRIRYK